MARFWKKINSKPYVILLAIAAVGLTYLLVRQYKTSHSIDKEVAELQKQAQSLKQSNDELESFVSYFQTDTYQEKVAREQLNVKKEGEFVYSFSDQTIAPKQEAGSEENSLPISPDDFNTSLSLETQSNPTKWWKYFFPEN